MASFIYIKRDDDEREVLVCRLFETFSDSTEISMDAAVTVDVSQKMTQW